MHRTFFALAVLGLACFNALATPAQATIENETHPTRCAEEDNVSLNLSGATIRRFRVEALPPAYLASIDQDRTAPDFTNCNFDGGAHPTDPRYTFKERRAVLHDGPRWQIVGITLPSFWRPQRVPVRVDGRRDRGFHMIQLFDKTGTKPLEALVMYPSDGYWRIKPLPAPRFGDGVYGSSFVMGPVEQAGRPVATITSIAIDTRPSLRFMLKFANGGAARVDVREVSEARTALDVSLEPGRKQGPRFAVLRSMYVEADNADMSEVWWKTTPDVAAQTRALPEVSTLKAADVRFGRRIPSRHNTSAPDIRFGDFQSGTPR